MKRFLLFIILPMWLLVAHSQLRLNGLAALPDVLCSIPEAHFGGDYEAMRDVSARLLGCRHRRERSQQHNFRGGVYAKTLLAPQNNRDYD